MFFFQAYQVTVFTALEKEDFALIVFNITSYVRNICFFVFHVKFGSSLMCHGNVSAWFEVFILLIPVWLQKQEGTILSYQVTLQ